MREVTGSFFAPLSKKLGEQRMPCLAGDVDEQRRSNATVQLQESGRRAQVSGNSLRLKIRTTLNVVPFGTPENKQRKRCYRLLRREHGE
jgi:hypothetical protein